MTTNTRKLGLTTSEAARRLGVSLSTIRRWSDLGYIRGYRTPGGQRRFSIEQLDEFLASLESGGPLKQAPPVESEGADESLPPRSASFAEPAVAPSLADATDLTHGWPRSDRAGGHEIGR